MSEKPFEIPQNLRDVSGQNLKQAHAAYEQLTDFVTKAVGVWMGAMPSNPMTAGFKDVQDRAMQIAKENAESAFTFAGKISNVRTFQDIVTLQMQFAQDQMKAFATQTQQLFSVIPRSYPEVRTRATSMDAMPANPMTAGFKDVQDRAVQIAMENAESAFAFADKTCDALTFEDILTLQTQFAQERMQALVTQTQQLYSVIEEAIQKSERGATGAPMGARPSNPMAAGFKDVQDRAVAMAKKNAELSFRAGRKDRQGTEFPGDCDTSDPFCSRADAGASKADGQNSSEAATRQIDPLTRHASYGGKREAAPKGLAYYGSCVPAKRNISKTTMSLTISILLAG